MSNIKDEKRYSPDKKDGNKFPHDKKIDPISGRYSDYVNPDAIPGVNTPGVRGVCTDGAGKSGVGGYNTAIDKFAMNNAGVNEIGYSAMGLALPAFNPPVPNRAWTAMRAGVDIDELSEEEKRELYYGHDPIL